MQRKLLALGLLTLAMADPAAASPREAAPRPSPKASPCPPGFAALENSSTCVRISGRVRADGLVGSPGTHSQDTFETRASGRVQLDVRKQTEYGPLRAVIRADTERR